MAVTAKRAVMDVLGMTIVVMPRMTPGPGFDPSEIKFQWEGH